MFNEAIHRGLKNYLEQFYNRDPVWFCQYFM